MIEDVWAAYSSEKFLDAGRLASTRLASYGGIDLIHIAGLSMVQMRRYDEGMVLLKAAVLFRPNVPFLYTNAAYIAEQLGMADELAFFTSRGLVEFPNDVDLQSQAANVHLIRQDYPAAIASYQRLAERFPRDIRSHINLGNTYRLLEDFPQAETHFTHAAAIDPSNAALRVARASLYGETGRVEEAIAMVDGVPDWDAKFMHALFALSIGDYARGWALHRDRWHSVVFKYASVPPHPVANLDQIVGQPVVVLREGGFGDVFQFMRYLTLLADKASEVLFHPYPSEMRLLRANLPANVHLQPAVQGPVHADQLQASFPDSYRHTIALLDLPYLFHTTIDTIPNKIPYLSIPEEIKAQRRPAPKYKKRVGLAWAGGPMTGLNQRNYDAHRSIDLHELSCLSELKDIEFCNLQFGDHAHDAGLLTKTLLRSSFDWLDTAAVIDQLDLVISVDTGIVHVAAALGRPTWLLSRFNPCWRWLRNRADSPWYPGVLRVFGQTTYGDWSATIAEVKQELEVWSRLDS